MSDDCWWKINEERDNQRLGFFYRSNFDRWNNFAWIFNFVPMNLSSTSIILALV